MQLEEQLEHKLLARVSYLYYELDKTQQEIADLLGINRMKVSRLLKKAKQEGVVSISIDFKDAYILEQNKLIEKYKLRDCLICDVEENQAKETLGAAGASYLKNLLKSNAVVAVGWGYTIKSVAKKINNFNTSLKNLTFVPIIGGHGEDQLQFHASQVAASFAKRTASVSKALLYPVIVSSVEERNSIVKENFIEPVLQLAKNAQFAIFSIGIPKDPSSSTQLAGYFTKKEIAELIAEDSICDVVSVAYLNEKGEERNHSLTERVIGLTAAELKAIPVKVCIAGGKEKAEAIKAALLAGYVDILITDKTCYEVLK